MKCEKCPADSALGCKAGVKPYQLRSGDTGCAWNLRIIKKHMNQSKPTNYDRIISKTPEELAEWLWFKVGKCPPFDVCPSQCIPCEAKDCWLDWLREEEQK